MKIERNKLLLGLLLVGIAALSRELLRGALPQGGSYIMFDMLFAVAGPTFIAGLLLGPYYGIGVPIIAMLIGDVYLYETTYSGVSLVGILSSSLFTWTGMALIGLFGWMTSKWNLAKKTVALASSWLLFDIWTNFGVWMFGAYAGHDSTTLLATYMASLPFMAGHAALLALTAPLYVLSAFYVQRALNLKEQAVSWRIPTGIMAALMIMAMFSTV